MLNTAGGTAAEPVETPWLTVEEAARYCRCSEWKIKQAARLKELESSGGGNGKPYRFLKEWLDYWMKHRR